MRRVTVPETVAPGGVAVAPGGIEALVGALNFAALQGEYREMTDGRTFAAALRAAETLAKASGKEVMRIQGMDGFSTIHLVDKTVHRSADPGNRRVKGQDQDEMRNTRHG